MKPPVKPSPLLMLGLLLALCLVRPMADIHAAGAVQPAAMIGFSEGTTDSQTVSRRSSCSIGMRYSSFYQKCVRLWSPSAY